MIEFIIPGKPIALKRARMARGRMYDSQFQVKSNIQYLFNKQFPNFLPLTGPIEIKLVFHMEIPKSYSKKKRLSLIQKPHAIKSDLDNLTKMSMDSLNGCAWVDDSQIYEIYAIKLYSTEPKTILQIEEKND